MSTSTPVPTKEGNKKGIANALGLPFLKNLSRKADAGSVPSDSNPGRKVKTKKLRRIRGLLTGESRRERKAKKEAERAAAVAAGKTPPVTQNPLEDDEQETIYGVDVENQSAVGPLPPVPNQLLPNAEKDIHDIDDGEGDEPSFMTDDDNSMNQLALQVILLLMDPKTRRFELLQLEFDSNKAVVRDVLSQVPHSVTEEALRNQSYSGVCDRTGQELYYSTRLCDVCSGSDVLIALPAAVDARECARLAKPILQDKNVIEMLRASGVDTSSLEKREAAITSPFAKMSPATPAAPTIQPRDIDIASRPEKKDAAAPPSPAKLTPSATKTSAVSKAPAASKPPSVSKSPAVSKAPAITKAPVVTKAPIVTAAPLAPPNAVASRVASPPSIDTAAEATGPPVEEKREDSKRTLFIVLLAAVAVLIQVIHMSVTAPLSPGHSLSPNAFMSKCGYKALLPSCREASLIMHEDGVLTLYGADGSVQWEILGSKCRSNADNCKNGLVVNDDGSLVIGGRRMNAAAIYGEAMFTPWPFTVSPNVRLVKGKK